MHINLLCCRGNLPTSIVQSVTQHDPFNPSTDPELGISYISAFILAYNITFWIGPTSRSLRRDYRPAVPHGKDAEIKTPFKETTTWQLLATYVLGKRAKAELQAMRSAPPTRPPSPPVELGELERGESVTPAPTQMIAGTSKLRHLQDGRNTSHNTLVEAIEPGSSSSSRRSSILDVDDTPKIVPSVHEPELPPPLTTTQRVLKQANAQIQQIFSPVVIAMSFAIPIALISPLKALFTHVDGGSYYFSSPNGEPPLGWFLSTCSFIGGIAVPLSVMQLGGSFAEIKIPRPLSRWPWTAMLLSAGTKLVLMPVIGVLLTQAFTKNGFIDKEDITLRFVAMFL